MWIQFHPLVCLELYTYQYVLALWSDGRFCWELFYTGHTSTQPDIQKSNAKQAIEFVVLLQAIHMVSGSGEKIIGDILFSQ